MLADTAIVSRWVGRGATTLALMQRSPGRACLEVVSACYADTAVDLAWLMRLER